MSKISSAKREVGLHNWRELIKAQKESGLSIKAWCSQNGISQCQYYYWLRLIRENAIDNLPAPIKDSLPAESDSAITLRKLEVQPPISGFQPAVVVHLPSATLEINNGADQHTVEAVLLALKTVC